MNALNPVQRVRDQIAEPIELRLSLSRAESLKRAGELLDLVGIPKKRGAAYPHELSGGMRQRAMIAMALACDPAIIIGDEPTTALDVMVQAQILALLERLRDELNLSLILITHDLSVIAETCDRVLIMYAGRVAEEGSVREVFARPRHPYTQKLLSAFPNIQADRRTLDVIPGSPPDLRTPPSGMPLPSTLRVRDARLLGGRAARGHPRRRRARRLPPLPRGAPTASRSRSIPPNAVGPTVPARRVAVRHARRNGSRKRPDGRRAAPAGGPQGPLPDPRRDPRRAAAPAPRRRPRRRRDRPDHPPGRGPRPRRRVGQRQDDHRPGGRQADPPDGRPGRLRRPGRQRPVGRGRPARVPAARPDHLPGPVRDAQPEADDPRLRGRADRGQPPRHVGGRPRGTGRPGARGGRSAAGLGLRVPLSARAVRRAAPARRHRRGAGHGPGADRRRRAGLHARRLDPDRAPAAHARPAPGARPDLPVHHPRPVAGLGAGGSDRGHVPRQGHGDRSRRAGHPRPAQPVHQGAGQRVADARTPRRAGVRARRTILVGETPDAVNLPRGCRFHPRCPLAFDRCRVEEPPLFDVGPGQQAACWLVEGGRSLPVMPSAAVPLPGALPSEGAA